MSLNPPRLTLSRTGWIIYGIVEVALFLVANFTAKSAGHPGTVSQICWITFLVGLLLAFALGAREIIRHRRGAR
jgi:hypothetical protein